MGDTIWVDVRGRPPGEALPDNSLMLRLEKQLDRLCRKLNVPKLSEFYDYSELEAQYGDLGDDEGEPGEAGPAGDDGHEGGVWFDPDPALAAVRALRDHLARHPEDLGFKPDRSRAHWPADLREELRYCQSVLEEAVARGRQFRFLIVP